MAKPVVAIVGRQNVGKSTLLNRLAGRRISVVEDLPGTTRDRVMADAEWDGRTFRLVDTGGLEIEPDTSIGRSVREQVQTALQEADLTLFVTDVRDGVTPVDIEIAQLIRQGAKPILLVANKADNEKLEMNAVEFHTLGLGEPLPISAHHGRGTADLLDRILELLPPQEEEPLAPEDALRVAIVGRPNVGKSMLLNALLGEERAIVDSIPGTTRDATDTPMQTPLGTFLLIDTAGMRRRGKQEVGIEKFSVLRTLQAIDRCDVALLVIDASEPLTAQDTHVAGYIQEALKGVVIVINKWDLVPGPQRPGWETYIRQRLDFLAYAPILYTSALTGEGVQAIIPELDRVRQERSKQVPPEQISSVIERAVAAQSPPRKGKRQLRVYRVEQSGVRPPTFTFTVSDPQLLHFSYRRYLENQLRGAFGFPGTALRLIFKAGRQR